MRLGTQACCCCASWLARACAHVCRPACVLAVCVQARSQESQLVFAHQQVELRMQELKAQAAALEAAQHNSAQLQDTVASLTEDLNKARQETAAGGRQGDAGCCCRVWWPASAKHVAAAAMSWIEHVVACMVCVALLQGRCGLQE